MSVELQAWKSLLDGPRLDGDPLTLVAPVKPSATGGSGSFLGRCDDGKLWWIKPPNHLQGGKVIVTEQVIGRLGLLIGAPVCPVRCVKITSDSVGWEFRPGRHLVEGVGHASAHVEGVTELRELTRRQEDDNRARHAGVFALWDWCWGTDDQWLYAAPKDEALHSHDHGHFLPGGHNWTEEQLVLHVDSQNPRPWVTAGLDAAELRRIAATLDDIDRCAIVNVLRHVPLNWPATGKELEALGWFVERRAPAAAGRLRALAATLGSG